jgi:hypothetical protein
MTDANVFTATESDHATVRRFLALAAAGLVPMYDPRRRLFCHALRKSEQGLIQHGISHRYTMMTLMGLHRMEQAGSATQFDTKSMLEALFADLGWLDTLGDLGVLLWLCALVCPERLSEIDAQLKPETALTRYRGGKHGVTMELAWFLTGLSYWAQACPEKLGQIEPVALSTYQALAKNRGPQGFFGHQARGGSIAGIVRGRIGSFADQVYPIYAMNQFSRAYGHQQAAAWAMETAQGICEAQGSLGQWWWHYDSRTGRVADGYPVFSVHQHAMAPMVLLELGETAHYDFRPWVYRGLGWINGRNELGFDMEDASHPVIWRCFYRSRRSLGRYLSASLGSASGKAQAEQPENLKVLFECRPYELGWLLYAFASRSGQNSSEATPASTSETTALAARQ